MSHIDSQDRAYAVGYQTLGPVLVAFVRLLFHQARRDRVQRLAFVARDGELLFQVARILAPADIDSGRLELRYVHLSRRAVAGAAPYLQNLQQDPGAIEQVMTNLQSVRGLGTAMDSFRSFYNVPAELISRHAARLHAENGNQADVRRLLGDDLAAADLAGVFAGMRDRLRRYLIQEEILKENSALVDIGWRCSLQKILLSESQAWKLPAPRGYYLGLWDEDHRDFPPDAAGLISDQRRGSGLYEGSAWHAAFLLESVCRAKHGMVSGFAEGSDGTIHPLHVEAGGTREGERQSERMQDRIQQGILAYARGYVESSPVAVAEEAPIRREAQKRLYRLAFFPSAEERAAGHSLVHSEPTSDDSAMYLIAGKGAGFRGWLAGLRSPWKGGYLRENGGRGLAILYCGVEGFFSHLPSGTKPAIRRLLLRG